MGRRKRPIFEFTILDAIRLAVLPEKHRTSAMAALLITIEIDIPVPVVGARQLAAFLTTTLDDANEMVLDILAEVRRQLDIRMDRADSRLRLKAALAMGSQVSVAERVNKIGPRIFGPSDTWTSIGRVSSKVERPTFNWMHRVNHCLVAGVDASIGADLVTGFVYMAHRGGPCRFGRLPRQVKTIDELCLVLGLHPRLLGTKQVRVDWAHRAFIVAETNRLPWVYP